jgi:hypothetical protein
MFFIGKSECKIDRFIFTKKNAGKKSGKKSARVVSELFKNSSRLTQLVLKYWIWLDTDTFIIMARL